MPAVVLAATGLMAMVGMGSVAVAAAGWSTTTEVSVDGVTMTPSAAAPQIGVAVHTTVGPDGKPVVTTVISPVPGTPSAGTPAPLTSVSGTPVVILPAPGTPEPASPSPVVPVSEAATVPSSAPDSPPPPPPVETTASPAASPSPSPLTEATGVPTPDPTPTPTPVP
jgi:hypothetical protein